MTKVQYLRNELQMSRAELARIAGVSDMVVHRIEKGKQYGGTSLNVMNRLAQALDVPLQDVVDFDRLEKIERKEKDPQGK